MFPFPTYFQSKKYFTFCTLNIISSNDTCFIDNPGINIKFIMKKFKFL